MLSANKRVAVTGETLGRLLPAPGWRTRFAPAPTGYLHLGHLVNAIYVWGLARAYGGHVVLRIEDHDRTRCRAEYEDALLEDLEWLGLTPDEGHVTDFRAGPTRFRQSDNGSAYLEALHRLESLGRVYPCSCSRRDILNITGPTAAGEEARYPGTCFVRPASTEQTHARRVHLDPDAITVNDLALGEQVQTPADQCGDLLVRDRFGLWTYQFAVVVDDFDQQIDVVIRGEDLADSTGRQVLLSRMLGRVQPPQFLHHGLVRHPDGRKLSKASHDTSLRELQAQGASAASLLGDAAWLVGLQPSNTPISADQLPTLFV